MPDRKRRIKAAFYSAWQLVRLAMLLLIAVGTAAHAAEREARGRFNVTVQVVNAGRAATMPKSVSSGRTLGERSMNQLKFNINTRAGYLIRFEIVDPAVEEVEIHGLGPVIRIASGARDVFIPSDASGQTVSYRVKIRSGSEPTAPVAVRATLLP